MQHMVQRWRVNMLSHGEMATWFTQKTWPAPHVFVEETLSSCREWLIGGVACSSWICRPRKVFWVTSAHYNSKARSRHNESLARRATAVIKLHKDMLHQNCPDFYLSFYLLCHRNNLHFLIHIFVEKVEFRSMLSLKMPNFDPCYHRRRNFWMHPSK